MVWNAAFKKKNVNTLSYKMKKKLKQLNLHESEISDYID